MYSDVKVGDYVVTNEMCSGCMGDHKWQDRMTIAKVTAVHGGTMISVEFCNGETDGISGDEYSSFEDWGVDELIKELKRLYEVEKQYFLLKGE